MIRKMVGKTGILCAAVAITVVLVAVAWVVTTRFSGNREEKVTAIEEPQITETEDNSIKARIKELASDIRNSQAVQKAEDFVWGTEETVPESVQTQTESPGVASEQIHNTSSQDAEIEELRQEAGRIHGRSGLFSSDSDPGNETLASVSDRQPPTYTSSAQPETSRNMEARRTVILEREAYDNAKEKVDEMLKDLGYVD